MLRQLHGLPGLFAAVFLVTLAVTGSILALAPALDRAGAVVPPAGEVNVAHLAGRVVANYPDTEQIVRDLSGPGGRLLQPGWPGLAGADLVNPVTCWASCRHKGKKRGFTHLLHQQVTVYSRSAFENSPVAGTEPVILVGAGAGIGPLTGFIRKNTDRNPMYLYWGGRSANSDFLYQPELGHYLEDRRLTGLSTAFSRSDERAYVQDRLRQDQTALRQMVETGAQILVCGGRDMAAGVKQVFEEILQPLRLEVDDLKVQGRYLEDVY